MIGEVSSIAAIPVIDAVLPIAAIPQIVRSSTSVGGFRLADLPAPVQQLFLAGAFWRDVAKGAIAAGVKDPAVIAHLIFFLQHPERMSAGVGKLIAKNELQFYKLRAEWELDFTIAERLLKPSFTPDVFLPESRSHKYKDFVTRQTTGKVTLMVHGRNSDGTGKIDSAKRWVGGFRDVVDTYDQMQQAVDSLGDGDTLYLANWNFAPWAVAIPANASSAARTWANLLTEKALAGVKIRIIVAQHPLFSPLMTDLGTLDTIINAPALDGAKRDNLKYLVSRHPDAQGVHHQKFMIAKKGNSTVAFCGGLDLSFNRIPRRWGINWVWHDVVAKLEGLIVHDLERQFVELWNQDRTQSTLAPLAGWKPFEKLTQGSASGPSKAGALNKHPVQMLRTVSQGPEPLQTQRDDIWRGYFRLIGRATRFLYLENQYFHEAKLADAIVTQVQSSPGMIVIVVVGTGTDDRQTVDPNASFVDRAIQQALVDATNYAFAMRLEFFKRLQRLYPQHLRVYTINYRDGILHTKLILADDEALSLGSANANPRGFFTDTELNFVLDHGETVRKFREQLWAHNLGLPADQVAGWSLGEFFSRWDAVAKKNQSVQSTPEKMTGEGVIPFEPWNPKDRRYRVGRRGPIRMPRPLRDIDPPENLF